MQQTRKIALIGAEGYGRRSEALAVDCYPWQKVADIANLRDYDIVLVNLLSLDATAGVDWFTFHEKLNPYTMKEILQPGGRIIVIGDPRFEFSRSSPSKGDIKEPFLAWTGVKFFWDDEPGDTVYFDDNWQHRHYEEYIKKLQQWKYSLRDCELDLDVWGKLYHMDRLGKLGCDLTLEHDYFCRNRYGGALAFSITIAVDKSANYGRGTSHRVIEFGPMIFLPKVNLSDDEAVVTALRSLCGVDSELPEPEWIADFKAPGQQAVNGEINAIRTDMVQLFKKMQSKEQERERARRCLKLLYERGETLAGAVREILRVLGAEVEDPQEPGKEDGWVVVRIGGHVFEGVLEVKGTKNDQFDETGIRQLLDWTRRGVELREKKYKGVFIGNSAVEKLPGERPWPFADNWTKSLQLHQMVALTTTDLYALHILNSGGRLDKQVFWQRLFATNGIFDIKTLTKAAAPKDGKKVTTV